MEIRRFTDEGIERFRNYLTELRNGSTSPPPFDLLNNSDIAQLVNGEGEVEKRIFNTRLDLARYLDHALASIENDSIETDVHLWSWLSLLYFDQVCPARENATRNPGRDYRHILEPGYPYGHRHLLCGAYLVYTTYGLRENLSKLFLSTPLPIESKVHHELATRQSLITNKGIIKATHMLYYDESTDKPKRGVIVKKNKPGTLYRFIDVIQQLDLNYDLYSMNGEEVLELLPNEFNKWKG